MTLGADNKADAPTIPINTYATPTPNTGLTIEGFEAAQAADWEYEKSAWWKFTMPTLAQDTANELAIEDTTVYPAGSWEAWFFLYREVDGSLVEVDNGSSFYLYWFDQGSEFNAGDTFYIKAVSWIGDTGGEIPYSFSIGVASYTYTDWVQGPDVSQTQNSFFWTGNDYYSSTDISREMAGTTLVHQPAHDDELAYLAGTLAGAQANGSISAVEGFQATMRSEVREPSTQPGRLMQSGTIRNYGAYLHHAVMVSNMSFSESGANPPPATWPEGATLFQFETVGGSYAWNILGFDATIYVQTSYDGISPDNPLVVDTYARAQTVKFDGLTGRNGTIVDTKTVTAAPGGEQYTITFSWDGVPAGGGVGVQMIVNTDESLPWTASALFNNAGGQWESRTQASLLARYNTPGMPSSGVKRPDLVVHATPPRHRFKIRHYMEPTEPPAGRPRRRPLRQHPRSDGLGMSSARRQDANRSMQASLRRGGGVYF